MAPHLGLGACLERLNAGTPAAHPLVIARAPGQKVNLDLCRVTAATLFHNLAGIPFADLLHRALVAVLTSGHDV